MNNNLNNLAPDAPTPPRPSESLLEMLRSLAGIWDDLVSGAESLKIESQAGRPPESPGWAQAAANARLQAAAALMDLVDAACGRTAIGGRDNMLRLDGRIYVSSEIGRELGWVTVIDAGELRIVDLDAPPPPEG